MNKAELLHELQQKHQAFSEYVASLSDTDFTHAPHAEKWTAGQQLDHIRLSVSPLMMAFGLPKWVPGLLFGKADKPSATYEEVVTHYQHILANGGKASKAYLPKPVTAAEKMALKSKTDQTLAQVLQRLHKFSETDLDRLRLPHPLIGKMTIREMLYFTLYHVQHHHAQTRENLANK